MGQDYNPCILHQGKDILIHYTTQVVTYWRNYLSKEKFRERYNQSRSSSKDSSKSGTLQPVNKDNVDPEIINLAETADKKDLELSKAEADPAPEVVNQTRDN